MTSLFDPYYLGGLHLRNRVVMPPMTRTRTTEGALPTDGDLPNALMAKLICKTAGRIRRDVPAKEVAPLRERSNAKWDFGGERAVIGHSSFSAEFLRELWAIDRRRTHKVYK